MPANFFFRQFALSDVVPNRYVLVRFPFGIKKRNDGRVDPINAAVFCPIAKLALPNFAAGNRGPKIAYEVF